MPEICSWTELKKLREDPAYNINLSDDTKRILQELGTEKGQASALLGGGGDKAQRAHALAVQAAKTRPEVEEGKEAPPPALSIVDAASAAVHGRSAEAAKASTAAKTAARVAAHAAGEIVPVNTKMVRLQFPLMTLYCSWELSASSVVWAEILAGILFFQKLLRQGIWKLLEIWTCISKFLNFLCMQVKSRYTTGAASRSFTSTSYDPVTENEYEYVHVERNPKKKGYVRMHTNRGDLNIELHCDITPRTCENFITLCERGYYDNVIFHRSIRYLMRLCSCESFMICRQARNSLHFDILSMSAIASFLGNFSSNFISQKYALVTLLFSSGSNSFGIVRFV